MHSVYKTAVFCPEKTSWLNFLNVVLWSPYRQRKPNNQTVFSKNPFTV